MDNGQDYDKSRPLRVWQEQRSRDTRKAIMEAATLCLVEHGYTKTSVPLIAELAGMSRGAILHHFPTRLDVISALIEHLHRVRQSECVRVFEALRTPHSRVVSEAEHRHRVEAAWAHVNMPWFLAHQELLAAARTDSELWGMIGPIESKFGREFSELLKELFPDWKNDDDFRLAMDLGMLVLHGMKASPIDEFVEDRQQKVISKLTEVIHEMYISHR